MINEEERQSNNGLKYILDAIKLISKETGTEGKIKCPKCGNDLHWTRTSSRNHVWGKCETENCISWML